jgi:hypothetical protein
MPQRTLRLVCLLLLLAGALPAQTDFVAKAKGVLDGLARRPEASAEQGRDGKKRAVPWASRRGPER